MAGSHAVLSPSSAHRWLECPGSVGLSKGIPDAPSVYAEEGTFAHDVAARCLDECVTSAVVFLGETDGRFTVDHDMVAAIDTYLDIVAATPGKLWIEERVKLLEECWGTSDAFVLSPCSRQLDVFDFKFGSGVLVSVQDNPQLKIYAAGALKTHSQRCGRVERVVTHVVQPRHALGGHVSAVYSAESLREWVESTLTPAARTALSPDAPLSAGEHCRWCPAQHLCPELRSVARQHARDVFDDDAMTVPAKTPPDPAALTPEQLRAALDAFPLIEQWIKAVRSHAYEQANHGVQIPGHKLVAKNPGPRKWKNPEHAEAVLAMLTEASLRSEPSLLSPAQAEQKLRRADRVILESLVERTSSGATLVPDSDPRPPLNAAAVFQELQD